MSRPDRHYWKQRYDFFLMIRRPPRSTLFPFPPLFRPLGLAVPDLRRHDPSGNRKVPLGRPTFFPFPFILPFIFSALVRRPRRDGISPAYNNPLISPFVGRHVGSGTLPVTMLRWCRQPSPSKATLALFLFATGTGSSGRGGLPVHLYY